MPRWRPGSSWTGVNNFANFGPLPDAAIARYIQRSATAFDRPGWLMLDRKAKARWLPLFQTAYRIERVEAFDQYAAYYLVPARTLSNVSPGH
jgi:hypothetical protein